MLVSLKWLRDYIDVELTPEEIAGKLTMAGLEVDSIDGIGPDFSGVVVAQILTVTRCRRISCLLFSCFWQQ